MRRRMAVGDASRDVDERDGRLLRLQAGDHADERSRRRDADLRTHGIAVPRSRLVLRRLDAGWQKDRRFLAAQQPEISREL
jgi:hypothetical protein